MTTRRYDKTSLEGHVILKYGIQHWKIPQTGSYVIEAWGASGGNGTNSNIPRVWRTGGLGARIKGKFFFNRGQILKILVGQQGQPIMMFSTHPGSGGGASFVTLQDNTPLIIAGGGGGGCSPNKGCLDGQHGQATLNGTSNGGSKGNGGRLPLGQFTESCGAGGGFFTDGKDTILSKGGSSFLSGGLGGNNLPSSKGNGGFGGGGAANSAPGGGGGYSGGGLIKTNLTMVSGGGGSFNAGKFKEGQSGVNSGDGKVIISIV